MAGTGWGKDIHAGEIGAEFGRGSGRLVHVLLLAILAFFVAFFAWAANAPLDVVTRGEAEIVPSGRVKMVQHLEGGIVSAILVREGDVVAKGQPLLRIRSIITAAELNEVRDRYFSLQAQLARLRAEADDLPEIAFPPALLEAAPKKAASQADLFLARREWLRAQIAVLEAKAAQKRSELRESHARLEQLRRSRALAAEEADLLAPLVRQGVIPDLDLIRVRQAVQDLDTEIGSVRQALPRIASAVDEAEARVEAKRTDFLAEARQELREKADELDATAQELAAVTDRMVRTEIVSPVHGAVNELLVHTVGGVIEPGQNLVEIVPMGGDLLVEGKIHPSDRAELRPGLDAVVKVTAYDYGIYGGLDATLIGISPDTLTDEEGGSYYRVRFRADAKGFAADKPIIPGMTATVDILTGEQTVLDYILDPLRDALDNALRER